MHPTPDDTPPEEQERIFSPAPPTAGRAFAATWWGRAWTKALEETALDSGQLKAGRRLARAGSVGAVSVRPGRLTAVVRDRDGTGHRTDVLLHRFTTGEWDRFLDLTVERAGHVAALLAHDMPHHLVEDAAAAGVELLPGIGDLEAECGCGAWDHCAHSSALCYQVARLLDEDPFVVLLLRGLGEGPLLAALQQRSTARQEQAGPQAPKPAGDGVDAHRAFAESAILPPLPVFTPVPSEQVQLPALDTEAVPGAGLDVGALAFLSTATAAEARRLLSRAVLPGHRLSPVERRLTPSEDAVRLLALSPPTQAADRLREGTGHEPAGLDAAVSAWRTGGAPALRVLKEQWEPDGRALMRAEAQLHAAWADAERPRLVRRGNRWTAPEALRQLRLGEDGRWWPYAEERGQWLPTGPPDSDPAAALATGPGSTG